MEELYNSIERARKINDLPVTTCDIHRDYDIVGLVYFQVNNDGNGEVFRGLIDKHKEILNELESTGLRSDDVPNKPGALTNLAISLFGKQYEMDDVSGNSHSNFDIAFYIAVQELKERAYLMGADAVVGMRQDIDLDTDGIQHFYLQMYGTAVKYR